MVNSIVEFSETDYLSPVDKLINQSSDLTGFPPFSVTWGWLSIDIALFLRA